MHGVLHRAALQPLCATQYVAATGIEHTAGLSQQAELVSQVTIKLLVVLTHAPTLHKAAPTKQAPWGGSAAADVAACMLHSWPVHPGVNTPRCLPLIPLTLPQ
jgi:hypothetical protein